MRLVVLFVIAIIYQVILSNEFGQVFDFDEQAGDSSGNVDLPSTLHIRKKLNISDEDMTKLKDKIKLLVGFSCYKSVQKYLHSHKALLREIAEKPKAEKILKKLIAQLFNTCVTNMTPDQQMSMVTAEAKLNMDNFEFEEFDEVDIHSYIDRQDWDITEEDLESLNDYHQIENYAKKLQSTHKNGENSDKEKIEDISNKYSTYVLGLTTSHLLLLFIASLMLLAGYLLIQTKIGRANNENAKHKGD